MEFQTDEGWTCRPPKRKNEQHLQKTSEWTERLCPHPEGTWRTSRNSGDTPLWQCSLPCPGVYEMTSASDDCVHGVGRGNCQRGTGWWTDSLPASLLFEGPVEPRS